MTFKTSFFNTSLLQKDLVRFAPAWALYAAFLIMVFSGNILSYDRLTIANSLGSSLSLFALFNLGYAMLCAQLLFGDLFQSRMCNALHAFPIRREGWFITHVLAGLLFCAIPVAAAGLVFLTVLGSYWLAALLWMAGLFLQYFFFFAMAVLSIMLVGNRFAAVVLYGILSFLSAIFLWLFYNLYLPHLYGLVLNESVALCACPPLWMTTFDWFCGVRQTGSVLLQEGWRYLLLCSAVGLLLLALALVLYRKRALEKAGDFMIFPKTEPVFLVLYTFAAGTFGHLFSNVFIGESTEYIFLVVGLGIGFFTGLMLLKRTLRVFRVWSFAQFGILMAVFGLSLLLTVLDPAGITRWIPKESAVKWVTLDYYSEKDCQAHAITDKNVIRQVLSIHEHGVSHPEEARNGVADSSIILTYKLHSGRLVQRQFYIDRGTVASMTLEQNLSRPEILFGSKYDTPDALLEELKTIDVSDYAQRTHTDGKYLKLLTDRAQMQELLDALWADALAGNLCQNWGLRQDNGSEYWLYLEGKDRSGADGYSRRLVWSICFSSQSTNTMAWFKENIH